MTDDDFSPDRTDRRDELVSSVLDGEATEQELREVDGDPELLQRLEHARLLRDAHVALASLGDHDADDDVDADRERRISAAMAGFDGSDPTSGDPLDEAADDRIADRRSSGSGQSRRRHQLPLIGAAATLLVLVLVLTLFARNSGDSTESTASGASDKSEKSDTPAGATTTVPVLLPPDPAATPAPVPSVPDQQAREAAGASDQGAVGLSSIPGATPLGDFSDIDALRRAAVDATSGSPAVDRSELPCADVIPGGDGVVVGVAQLQGTDVITVLPVAASGTRDRPADVVVLVVDSCSALD